MDKIIARNRIATANSLWMDLDDRRVMVGAKEIKFTDQEFHVLWLLAINKNRIVCREDIFSFLPKTSSKGPTILVNVVVCRIRKKLSVASETDLSLQSVRAKGYVLIEGDSALAD